jgi:Ca2+-binding EF-hand superfamily protein
MLRRQEGAYNVDNKEVARYLVSLRGCYKLEEAAGLNGQIERLMKEPGKMTPDQWLETLNGMPVLKKTLEDDYMPDKVRFSKFRSCGQQLSKLFANLDRARLREAKGEDVKAEIETRKKQARKMRNNGVFPSPGVSVFAQLDVDKSGTISEQELFRLFKGLAAVYPRGDAEIREIMKTLDSDNSGEIDEEEWKVNLDKCPGLKAALVTDLNPDTGRLMSYRTQEDQLAKLFGNIDRLEQDEAEGKDVAKELASRKAQAAKLRACGILPNPGIVVFNQIDKDKSRSINMNELKDVISRLGMDIRIVDRTMAKMDLDNNGTLDEQEWLTGLNTVQSLKAALLKDLDPETGKLKCFTSGASRVFSK